MRQEEIEAILSMDDLIMRNLCITQGYHRLSEGMKAITGSENVAWPGFGTYASKTAGYSIRHDLPPEDIASVLGSFRYYKRMMLVLRRYLSSPAERDNDLDLINQVLAHISLGISKGNHLVFAELAPAYARMAADFAEDDKYDETKLADFLARFKPGASESGGQDNCKEAFTVYYQAKFATEPKRKAELIFLGNLLIGFHEQTQLQPIILESMHAPVDEVLGEPLPLYITPLGKRINGWVHKAFLGISRRVFTKVATWLFMSIYLPTRELRLSYDVESVTPGTDFPRDLQNIRSDRVRNLLGRFDRTGDTLSGSRVEDWSDMDDRMNFIVDFFRSHQQNQELYLPPFTPEQTASLEAGRMPEGKL